MPREWPDTMVSPTFRRPALGRPMLLLDVMEHRVESPVLEIQCKDGAHLPRLFLIDDEFPTPSTYVVAQHGSASYPFAFASCRRHLVARTIYYKIPFELGK